MLTLFSRPFTKYKTETVILFSPLYPIIPQTNTSVYHIVFV